jgi:hypothetical protein
MSPTAAFVWPSWPPADLHRDRARSDDSPSKQDDWPNSKPNRKHPGRGLQIGAKGRGAAQQVCPFSVSLARYLDPSQNGFAVAQDFEKPDTGGTT